MTTDAMAGVVSFLLTYLVHSTLLLGGVAVLDRWVGRESWRETFWKAALLGSLATTMVAVVAPAGPARLRVAFPVQAVERVVPQPTAEPADRGLPLPAVDAATPAPAPEASVTSGQAAVERAPAQAERMDSERPELSAAGAALLLWFGVTLLLLARLGWRHLRLFRLLRDRRPVAEQGLAGVLAELRRLSGFWQPVRLTATPAVASPLVLGGGEICVPDRFVTELNREEQRAALAHELAHLVRRDPAWQLTARVLECVFFYQPLQRLARRRLRESAEYLADGWAVRHAGGRLSLARCLAEVAAWVGPSEPGLEASVAMAEGGSPLLDRVSRLLDREPEAEPRLALRAVAALGLVALGAGFAPVVGSGDAAATAAEPDGLTAETAAPETLDVRRFEGPAREGSSFIARLNEAGRDAAGQPYWVAYVVSSPAAKSALVIDSEPWSADQLAGAGVAQRLGVGDALGDVAAPVIVLARLVPRGAATGVERLAVRSPQLGFPLGGRVYWLGAAEPQESFRWLRDIYTAVRAPAVRETAVDAIAVHPTPGALDFLREVIEARPGRNLREQAVEGLAHHPGDESLALLARLAELDADPLIRSEAVETLGELEHAGADVILRQLATRGGAGEREEALEGLVERQDTALANLLLDLALHDDEPDIRREAVERIAELPPSVAVPLLRRVAFESGDETAERQAAESLGDVGTREALDVLDEILRRNPGEEASFQAVESIGENFAPALAIPRLRRIVREHPSSRVRREALDYLVELGDRP